MQKDDDGEEAAEKRPLCPKCGMRMIKTNEQKSQKRALECLRCGFKTSVD